MKKNELVGIAGTLSGSLVIMSAIIALFASSHLWVIAPVAFSFAILGIFLGFFSRKK